MTAVNALIDIMKNNPKKTAAVGTALGGTLAYVIIGRRREAKAKAEAEAKAKAAEAAEAEAFQRRTLEDLTFQMTALQSAVDSLRGEVSEGHRESARLAARIGLIETEAKAKAAAEVKAKAEAESKAKAQADALATASADAEAKASSNGATPQNKKTAAA